MNKIITRLKNPRLLRFIVLIIAIIAILGGYIFYQLKIDRVLIDNSLAQAPLVEISPTTPQTLDKIYVYEGENVRKGDPLAEAGGQIIRADSDGVIVKTNDTLGSIVSAQNPILELINPETLRIQGTLDENKGLNQIKVGQAVSFTVDAFPGKTYWGYVDEISPTALQTQLTFSISSERPTQQFNVYARFDPGKYPEIKNGMSAKMTVYTRMP